MQIAKLDGRRPVVFFPSALVSEHATDENNLVLGVIPSQIPL